MLKLKQFFFLMLLLIVASSALWIFAQSKTTDFSAQDYLDIQQLYAEYNHALDASDANRFAALFSEDGSLAGNTGRDALVQVIKGTEQLWQGKWRHLYSNLVITPTAEGANATSFLFAYDVTTKPATITNTGIYTDKLVKTSQGWRFQQRTFANDAQ